MAELLIELFYEEIPALMQKPAEIGYKEIFTTIFQKHQIGFKELEIFIGPRRIAIYAAGMDKIIPAKNIEHKGPAINAQQTAIDGFCKAHNITLNELSQTTIKNQNFYIYSKAVKEQKLEELLIVIIPTAIKEYIWPKSMYWGSHDLQTVRPLRNILCLFDKKILPFKLGHLIANNKTSGHRFMGAQDLEITNFSDYTAILEQNYVILDRKERMEIIKSQISQIADSYSLALKQDDKLLEEVAGLVEYPVAMIGRIDKKFLKLPKEVLISSIRTHQKYFNLFDAHSVFAPYFLFISNIKSPEPEIIISGNEKVLTARLSDALYFYEQDCKKPLENYNISLKSMVFHRLLGNMEEKTHRIAKLCHYLDPKNIELHLAARLCKSDLVSRMVGEFPELQGIMGYYYALHEGLSEDVALSIYDHYKPLGPDSAIPSGNAALLAISDKIDSLSGLMLAGEMPTGSRDPYALRRLALGIIRIILENHIHINLKNLVDYACDLYNINSAITSNIIINFINERARNYFKTEYEHNLINAVVDLSTQSDLVITNIILINLRNFISTEKGADSLSAYKRVNNILAGTTPTGEIQKKLLSSTYEKILIQSLEDTIINLGQVLKDNNFKAALNLLKILTIPINNFFDNVMIKDGNNLNTHNRLLLLQKTKDLFHKIAKFDLL